MPPPILIKNARLLTMCGHGNSTPPPGGRRGAELGTLGAKDNHDLLIVDTRIAEITPAGTPESPARREALAAECTVIDAHHAVVMPGFVDAHTHACWAGSRLDEWQRRLAGATYLEIMAAGGGIMSTVRAVRAASVGEL
ncbi:MAG: amidohydrolase family protein, partial [Phycisphaerales bacterium]|nr:amidohydrolase family protein [Phycisphaerales bacterium]